MPIGINADKNQKQNQCRLYLLTETSLSGGSETEPGLPPPNPIGTAPGKGIPHRLKILSGTKKTLNAVSC